MPRRETVAVLLLFASLSCKLKVGSLSRGSSLLTCHCMHAGLVNAAPVTAPTTATPAPVWVAYNGHDYLYHHLRMTYADAEAHCQSLGAHLTSIHSQVSPTCNDVNACMHLRRSVCENACMHEIHRICLPIICTASHTCLRHIQAENSFVATLVAEYGINYWIGVQRDPQSL